MINSCTISGIIFSEPHFKVTNGGVSIASFILELDVHSGERRPKVRIKMWRAVANTLHEVYEKGDHIIIQGVLSYDPGKIPETDDYKYYNTVVAKGLDCYTDNDHPINKVTMTGYSAGEVQLKKHHTIAELISLEDPERPFMTEGFDKPIMGLMVKENLIEEKKHLWIEGVLDTYVRLNDADQKRTSLLVRPANIKVL